VGAGARPFFTAARPLSISSLANVGLRRGTLPPRLSYRLSYALVRNGTFRVPSPLIPIGEPGPAGTPSNTCSNRQRPRTCSQPLVARHYAKLGGPRWQARPPGLAPWWSRTTATFRRAGGRGWNCAQTNAHHCFRGSRGKPKNRAQCPSPPTTYKEQLNRRMATGRVLPTRTPTRPTESGPLRFAAAPCRTTYDRPGKIRPAKLAAWICIGAAGTSARGPTTTVGSRWTHKKISWEFGSSTAVRKIRGSDPHADWLATFSKR